MSKDTTVRIHFCGEQSREPKDCPRSTDDGKCPDCQIDTESDYGFAGGYGLGIYNFFPKCFKIFDFCEDEG